MANNEILWHDLTVDNAEAIKGFYSKVFGWKTQAVSMGDYDDYIVMDSDGKEAIGGICHKRGVNSNIPSQWMIYFKVDDLKTAIDECLALGGEIIDGPKDFGDSDFCIFRDPAGACFAMYSKKSS